MSTKNCIQCNKSFNPTVGSKGLYCSHICSIPNNTALKRERARINRERNEQNYLDNPKSCSHCKKMLRFSSRKNNFCSSSCAAKQNNKIRIRTKESRVKTSNTLKKLFCRPDFNKKIKSVKIKTCIICEKQITGNRKTCSQECLIEKLRQVGKENVVKNRHKYLGPHKRSYMEQSFVEWLENHNIKNNIYGYYEQVHFKHKVDGKVKNGWIDFLFPSRKLVIELDGNHHLKRKELDNIRDDYLISKGYKVVRITHSEYKSKKRVEEIKKLLL